MTTATTEPVPQTAEFNAAFTSPAKFVQALEQTIRLDAKQEYQESKNDGRTNAIVNSPECTVEFLKTVDVTAASVIIQTLISDLIRERDPQEKRDIKVTTTQGDVIISEVVFPAPKTRPRDFGGAVTRAIWGAYTRIATGLEK